MNELGHPELNANYWGAVFAPAGTPPPSSPELHSIIVQGGNLPEVKEKFLSNQMIPVSSASLEDARKWNAGRSIAGARTSRTPVSTRTKSSSSEPGRRRAALSHLRRVGRKSRGTQTREQPHAVAAALQAL